MFSRYAFPITGIVAAALLALWGYRSIEERGALRERLQVQTGQHHADSLASVEALAMARAAAETADRLRALARAEVRRDSAVARHADSVMASAASERDEARRLLADSLATVPALRVEMQRLVAAGAADSTASAERAEQDGRTIRALLLTVAADSSAQAKQSAAVNAMLARAVASESQVETLRAARPSVAGNLVRSALYVAAGVGLSRLLR